MYVDQCRVTLAYPTIPQNTTAIPAAIAQVGTAFRLTTCGKCMPRAPSAGHTATHSRHPVHSADLMVTSLSTGRFAGHALWHLPQSMQAEGVRRMCNGLSRDANPISAP